MLPFSFHLNACLIFASFSLTLPFTTLMQMHVSAIAVTHFIPFLQFVHLHILKHKKNSIHTTNPYGLVGFGRIRH